MFLGKYEALFLLLLDYDVLRHFFEADSKYGLVHADLLLGLFFDPEDGGDIFLRIVGLPSVDYMALYLRRYNS
jgi:hypothetical protein